MSNLPTRSPPGTGKAAENQTLANVGGGDTIRKTFRTDRSSGSPVTTMLQTRDGMPTFRRVNLGLTGEDEEGGSSATEVTRTRRTILSGIIITEYFPFGMQVSSNGATYAAVNANYSQPSYSFTIGTLDATGWHSYKCPESNPGLGCNTWYDSQTYELDVDEDDAFSPYAWSWHTLVPCRQNTTPKGYLRCYLSEGLGLHAYTDAFAVTLAGQSDRDLLYVVPNANPRVEAHYAQKPTGTKGDILSIGETVIDGKTWICACYGVPNVTRTPAIIDNVSISRQIEGGTESEYFELPNPTAHPLSRVKLAPVFSADGSKVAGAFMNYPFEASTIDGSVTPVALRGHKSGSAVNMTLTGINDPNHKHATSTVETWTNGVVALDYVDNDLQYIRLETYKKVSMDDTETYTEAGSKWSSWDYKQYSYPYVGGSYDNRPGTEYVGDTSRSRDATVTTWNGSKLVLEPSGVEIFKIENAVTQSCTFTARTSVIAQQVFEREWSGYGLSYGLLYPGDPPPVGPDFWGYSPNGVSIWTCYGYTAGLSVLAGEKYTYSGEFSHDYREFKRIAGCSADIRSGFALVTVETWLATSARRRYEIERSRTLNWRLIEQSQGEGHGCGPSLALTLARESDGAADIVVVHSEGWVTPPEDIVRYVTQEHYLVDIRTGAQTLVHSGGNWYGNNSFIYSAFEGGEPPDSILHYGNTNGTIETYAEGWGEPFLNAQAHVSFAVSRDRETVVVSIMEPNNAQVTRHPQEMTYGAYAKTDSLSKIITKIYVIRGGTKQELAREAISGSGSLFYMTEMQIYDEVVE